MTVESVVSVIQSVGFPVFVALFYMWDSVTVRRQMTAALSDLTVAVNRLAGGE